MQRRYFITLLGGAATWPLVARAQQKAMPVVGYLHPGALEGQAILTLATFRQGLSEAGYVEGQNLAIEYRWAESHYDRLPVLAADLVGRKVDLIAAVGNAALAAKSATATIPIVFMGVGDPVAMGLVASLARPGGNLTGFSNLIGELMSKRLELLSEVVPQARVIALLVNPHAPTFGSIIRGMQEAAHAKGMQLAVLQAGTEGEIDAFCLPRRTACRRAHRRRRCVFLQPARTARGAGITPCRSGKLCVARRGGGRRPDQLWN
jgi:putative ABC transport system substrate-binding protein